MAGLVNAVTTPTASTDKYKSYNGQQVLTDDNTKALIASSAKAAGKDPMEYDKSINPTTYGARWGVADPSGTPAAPTVPAAPASPQQQLDDSKAYYARAGKATGSGYTSTDWNVGKDQTVAGQLTSLTDPNSPLNQQAAAQALQTSNARGLANSSLAVTAGQAAVLDKALPIAQQDASTFATAAQTNAGAKTAASAFGANAGNQASLNNSQLDTNVSTTNAGIASAANLQDKQSSTQLALADKNNAANNALGQIQANTQLSVADKSAASAQFISQLNATTSEKLAIIQQNTSLSVADKNAISNQVIAAADVASREKIANLSADTQKFLGDLTASTSLATTKLSADTQLALGSLDATTKTNLQNIVSKNSQALQANTSAANVVSQGLASIATVQSNDKLDANAKQQAINNILATMQQGISLAGDVAGLDLSKYFQQEAAGAVVPTNQEIPDGNNGP